MISKLFGTDNLMDFISTPAFWIGFAIVLVLVVLIIFAFKYQKLGMPVLLGVLSLGFIVLTAYCGIKLNSYYSAEGGIHGKLTGIFETNEVKVVDDMSFKFDNIELKESSPGIYSAGIVIDEVLSIDTLNSLGVFVNGMPCDITSEVHQDYVIAEYVYTFYDSNKSAILTDSLTINIAFYENSTYLSLSTKGGVESIKYWHYYFNKNGFVVSIQPFNYVDLGLDVGSGDVSNFVTLTFETMEETFVEYYSIGSEITLPKLSNPLYYYFLGWSIDGVNLISNNFVVSENVNLIALYSDKTTDGTFSVSIYLANDGVDYVFLFEFVIKNNEFVSVYELDNNVPMSSIDFNRQTKNYLYFDFSYIALNFDLRFVYDYENECWDYLSSAGASIPEQAINIVRVI